MMINVPNFTFIQVREAFFIPIDDDDVALAKLIQTNDVFLQIGRVA